MLIAYIEEKLFNNKKNAFDLVEIDRRLLTGGCNTISVPNPVDVFKKMHEFNLKDLQNKQSMFIGRKLNRKEKKEYSALIVVNAEVYKKISEKQKKSLEKKARLVCI